MSADPHPHDDGTQDPPPSGGSVCPLCGAATRVADARCPACSMTLAGTGGRPGPFPRAVIWWWAAALLAIYLVVLAVVALVPA